MNYFERSPIPYRIVLGTALVLATLFLLQAYMHHDVDADIRDTGAFNWWREAPVPYLNFLFWALLCPLVYSIYLRWPLNVRPVWKNVAVHIGFGLLVGSFHEVTTSSIYYYILTVVLGNITLAEAENQRTMVALRSVATRLRTCSIATAENAAAISAAITLPDDHAQRHAWLDLVHKDVRFGEQPDLSRRHATFVGFSARGIAQCLDCRDRKEIDRLMDTADMPALYRRINVERNDAWLTRLERSLAGTGNVLVVVGALVTLVIFASLFVAGAQLPPIVYGIPVLPIASIVLAMLPVTGRWCTKI